MAKDNHNDVWEAIRELRDSQKQTDELVKKTQTEIGHLTNSWGDLVEAQVIPAIPKYFAKWGINEGRPNVNLRLNGKYIEVDAIGVGEGITLCCSIKSRLTRRDVDEFIEKMEMIGGLLKRDGGGMRIMGAVAGARVDGGIDKYAQRKGLFVLVPSGDMVKPKDANGFKPKYF